MKKNFLLVLMTVFAFISCEGPMGPPGPMGPQGEPGESGGLGEGMNWKIETFVVEENQWKLYYDEDGLNPYYMCEKSYSALDNFIYTDGNVFVYLIQSPGESNEVQTPLPYTIPLENGEGNFWFETVTFDIMPGSIAFYVRYDDFAVDIRPARQEFRVVMNW